MRQIDVAKKLNTKPKNIHQIAKHALKRLLKAEQIKHLVDYLDNPNEALSIREEEINSTKHLVDYLDNPNEALSIREEEINSTKHLVDYLDNPNETLNIREEEINYNKYRSRQNMHQYFNQYTCEEVINAIEGLPEKDYVVYIKYYPDLINKNDKKIDEEDLSIMSNIVDKIKVRLNRNRKVKTKKR